MKDKRPDPKPRKYPELWQFYLFWYETMEMRKRHVLRLSSIEKGKSWMNAGLERDFLAALNLDENLEVFRKAMIKEGRKVSIWPWVTAIRGLKQGSLAAQLIAQIDDIAKFDTISKLWRFSGWGMFSYWVDAGNKVIAPKEGWKAKKERGKKSKKVWTVPDPKPGWRLVEMPDRRIKGWYSPFNAKLKGVCWNIADQFIRQQTSVYVDKYYEEKARQRREHQGISDGHSHNRAVRKMVKLFLSHLWVEWRTVEDLPVTMPYILRPGSGHNRYIEAPHSLIASET